MKHYKFYHKDTGMFLPHTFSTDDVTMLKNNTPENHIALEGTHDHLSKRVNIETGELMDYQPPQPSEDHVWNNLTHRWVLSVMAQKELDDKQAAQRKRVLLLHEQHDIVRKALLGDAEALEKLKELDNEIAELDAKI